MTFHMLVPFVLLAACGGVGDDAKGTDSGSTVVDQTGTSDTGCGEETGWHFDDGCVSEDPFTCDRISGWTGPSCPSLSELTAVLDCTGHYVSTCAGGTEVWRPEVEGAFVYVFDVAGTMIGQWEYTAWSGTFCCDGTMTSTIVFGTKLDCIHDDYARCENEMCSTKTCTP